MIKSNKTVVTWLLIFFVGGFGGLFVQKYIAPFLSQKPVFRHFGFLRTDTPLVITRTEQVRINENVNLRNLIKDLTPRTVLILGGRGEIGRNFEEQTRGSGVILSSDGVIATDNALFAERRSTYVVVTSDGQVLEANVLSVDPKSSLALIKVVNGALPTVNFGITSELELGQQLVVLSGSETLNSSTFRDAHVTRAPGDFNLSAVFSSEDYQSRFGLEQMPGPGDGVFTLNGQLVAIGTRGGILPVEVIRSAQESYFANQRIVRPLLGLRYGVFSKAGSQILAIPVSEGIILRGRQAGPAAAAGLRDGDVIYKVNGESINIKRTPLDTFLDRAKPGDVLNLSVLRAGQELEISVILGELR